MAEQESILVVEDDSSFAKVLRTSLRAHGYRVQTVKTGELAVSRVAEDPPAVVLLDLRLPGIDGIEVCRRLRHWTAVPIVVLTAEGSDQSKVLALDEGADDYVTKPFSMPELLARIRVALRHRHALGGQMDDTVLEVGDLHIDVPHHRVTVAGRMVELTPKEFQFLAFLARHPGRVLLHSVILKEVWGPGATDTQYLRVYAGQLRRKLEDDPNHPRLVTEPGVGYRLVDPFEDTAARA
ncbi:MAG TPA: response regulator transcription factor [Acidimicrobiales bacterium]|nr:response regulator transcription factor [Acidimicrobiales bacterium]